MCLVWQSGCKRRRVWPAALGVRLMLLLAIICERKDAYGGLVAIGERSS